MCVFALSLSHTHTHSHTLTHSCALLSCSPPPPRVPAPPRWPPLLTRTAQRALRDRQSSDRAPVAAPPLRPSRAARAHCRRCRRRCPRRSVVPSVCLMRVCGVCARSVCTAGIPPLPSAARTRAPRAAAPARARAPALSPSRPSRCSCLHCLVPGSGCVTLCVCESVQCASVPRSRARSV